MSDEKTKKRLATIAGEYLDDLKDTLEEPDGTIDANALLQTLFNLTTFAFAEMMSEGWGKHEALVIADKWHDGLVKTIEFTANEIALLETANAP